MRPLLPKLLDVSATMRPLLKVAGRLGYYAPSAIKVAGRLGFRTHHPLREMGGAPRNPAPRSHFLVWIVKPSGCHCTDAFGGKTYRRVPTRLRSTSPFSDPSARLRKATQEPKSSVLNLNCFQSAFVPITPSPRRLVRGEVCSTLFLLYFYSTLLLLYSTLLYSTLLYSISTLLYSTLLY